MPHPVLPGFICSMSLKKSGVGIAVSYIIKFKPKTVQKQIIVIEGISEGIEKALILPERVSFLLMTNLCQRTDPSCQNRLVFDELSLGISHLTIIRHHHQESFDEALRIDS